MLGGLDNVPALALAPGDLGGGQLDYFAGVELDFVRVGLIGSGWWRWVRLLGLYRRDSGFLAGLSCPGSPGWLCRLRLLGGLLACLLRRFAIESVISSIRLSVRRRVIRQRIDLLGLVWERIVGRG